MCVLCIEKLEIPDVVWFFPEFLKGTDSVISSDPPCKDGTLKSFF